LLGKNAYEYLHLSNVQQMQKTNQLTDPNNTSGNKQYKNDVTHTMPKIISVQHDNTHGCRFPSVLYNIMRRCSC